MGIIYEDEFNIPDSEDTRYSQLEYDLYAKLNLTLRKNLEKDYFEIVNIITKKVNFAGTLEEMVRIANHLEGDENTTVGIRRKR